MLGEQALYPSIVEAREGGCSYDDREQFSIRTISKSNNRKGAGWPRNEGVRACSCAMRDWRGGGNNRRGGRRSPATQSPQGGTQIQELIEVERGQEVAPWQIGKNKC